MKIITAALTAAIILGFSIDPLYAQNGATTTARDSSAAANYAASLKAITDNTETSDAEKAEAIVALVQTQAQLFPDAVVEIVAETIKATKSLTTIVTPEVVAQIVKVAAVAANATPTQTVAIAKVAVANVPSAVTQVNQALADMKITIAVTPSNPLNFPEGGGSVNVAPSNTGSGSGSTTAAVPYVQLVVVLDATPNSLSTP
jgi:hypothetical protein